MKTNLFKVLFAFAFFSILTISCEKNEDPEPLTKEEALEVLNTMGTEMDQVMSEMTTTQGMTTLNQLMILMEMGGEPESNQINFVKALPSTLEKVVLLNLKEIKTVPSKMMLEDDFNPGSMMGTFTWNFEYSTWIYSEEPADKLIFIFPSNPNQTTNDASLTIFDYTELTYGEDIFPTSLMVSLLVGETEVLSLDYAAVATLNGLQSISLSLEMIPFSLNLNLEITSETDGLLIEFSHDFKKDDVKIMSSQLEAFLTGITSLNPFITDENMEEVMPKYLKGFYQLGQIKFQLDLDFEEFINDMLSSTTEDAYVQSANTNLKVVLYTYPQGAKIADIKWVWDNEVLDIVPYLLFSDGTEMPLTDFLPEDFEFDLDIGK